MLLISVAMAISRPAAAAETSAVYRAYWAGLPAGEIRLTLRDEPSAYHSEIAIKSDGLPRVLTRFRGSAASDGRLAATAPLTPIRYDAVYDLRKRKDRRLSMRFAPRPGGAVAERGPDDTSKKPMLAEAFRTNVLDPLSALAAIRAELRRGNRGQFTIPVYDGARRFDVRGQVLPQRSGDSPLNLKLELAPIAGFKGETSDDGDPDDAPRPLALTVSDDQRLMPLSMSVSVAYLPLVVQFDRWCSGTATPCQW